VAGLLGFVLAILIAVTQARAQTLPAPGADLSGRDTTPVPSSMRRGFRGGVARGLNFYFNPYSKESKAATVLQTGFLALKLGDYTTSKIAFSSGARELNPLISPREPWFALELLGLSGFVNYASKTMGLCHSRACRIERFTLLGFAVAVEGYAVGNNLKVIHTLRSRTTPWSPPR